MKQCGALKILMCVDILSDAPGLIEKQARAIRIVSADEPVAVFPVHVVSPETVRLQGLLSERVDVLWSQLTERVRAQVSALDLPGLQEPQVISAHSRSHRGAIAALLEHADAIGADLISLNTHASLGVERLLLGSFAETLALRSSIPLLIVNPHWEPKEYCAPARYALLPIDFSNESRAALPALARALHGGASTITLFHQPTYTQFYLGEPSFVLTPEMIARDRARLTEQGDAWAADLRREGFSVVFQLGDGQQSVADAIVDTAAKTKAAFIAIQSHRGPVGNFFFGSTPRRVLRAARCPVWVLPRTQPVATGHGRVEASFVPVRALLA